jgi:hypothetical protein
VVVLGCRLAPHLLPDVSTAGTRHRRRMEILREKRDIFIKDKTTQGTIQARHENEQPRREERVGTESEKTNCKGVDKYGELR